MVCFFCCCLIPWRFVVKRTQFIEASTFSKAGIFALFAKGGNPLISGKTNSGIIIYFLLFFHKMHGLPNYPHQTTPRNKGLLRPN